MKRALVAVGILLAVGAACRQAPHGGSWGSTLALAYAEAHP